jgi:hypothetical protein
MPHQDAPPLCWLINQDSALVAVVAHGCTIVGTLGIGYPYLAHSHVCFLLVVGSGATVGTLGIGYPYLHGYISPED